MKVTVLGSGTSTGVPVPGCKCSTCLSTNPKNKRFRTSIVLEIDQSDGADEKRFILVDSGPDLRSQALRFNLTRVDAVLYTHVHADHVNGIDDLRPFNFLQRQTIPIFATSASATVLQRMFHYAFFVDPNYQGGSPPRLSLNTFEANEPLSVFGATLLPLAVKHGSMEVIAYRIGKFAYITDCSFIPKETKEMLHGLEVLILDGLRHRPHPTHFTLEQAVREIEEIKPKRSYLTHISHEVDHEEANTYLRNLTSETVELAYDGLEIQLA